MACSVCYRYYSWICFSVVAYWLCLGNLYPRKIFTLIQLIWLFFSTSGILVFIKMISLINRLIQSPTLSQKGKSIFNLLLNVLYITKEPNLTFNQIDGQLYSAINWIIPLLYLKYAKIMVYLWIIIFHWSILSSLCPNYLNFPKAASWHIFICSGNTTLSSLFILFFVIFRHFFFSK